jgi:hypothetical protein
MQGGNEFNSQNTQLLARMTWVLGSKAKFSQKEFQQKYMMTTHDNMVMTFVMTN